MLYFFIVDIAQLLFDAVVGFMMELGKFLMLCRLLVKIQKHDSISFELGLEFLLFVVAVLLFLIEMLP